MWQPPRPPANEAERLRVLAACNIMDTGQDERFDRLTRLATALYQVDVAFLSFIDDAYQWMKAMSGPGLAPVIERRRTVCNLIVESGQPLVVGDLHTDPRLVGHPVAASLPFRFYAGVPLMMAPDLAVGTLCVLGAAVRETSGVDIAPLTDLGAIAMDELDLWKINQDLKRRADTDSLTGLGNRRAFDEELERAGRRARRTGAPVSLLLVDLDHFKAVNDVSGHPAGDAVLRRAGQRLGQAVHRADDMAARYGGEEFAILLPGTDAAGAAVLAEAIRADIAAADMPHPLTGRVTASIGAATHQGAAADTDRLVAEADRALYRAKALGRDRVVLFEAMGEALTPAALAGAEG
ncbi:sensor domain-containing diguanylate cyclase [Aquabacter sp. L1I39]|uniref:GGDEF domain-containing protein n=1 Tax=Aquabacter sp. L1I39 TaxID=2820278 RepID=UPI001ADB4E78|nr:sensor domain-containing diguanylate cyclase [Aquabacter sp. L1I39]QTL03390.1 sensor domain-containing diguanylate cyclase [Aquabacter sp. L1I39]